MTTPERDYCPCGELRDDFGACWKCDGAKPFGEAEFDRLVHGGQGHDAEEVEAPGNAFAYCVAAALVFLAVLGLVKFVAWASAAAVPTVPK